jgi:hypothetical protein
MLQVCVVPSGDVVEEDMSAYGTPDEVEYLQRALSSVATIMETVPGGMLLPMGAITVISGGSVWLMCRSR